LALAAVATGSVAIPSSEPAPSAGIAEQPDPKVWAAASDDPMSSDGLIWSLGLVDMSEDIELSSEAVLLLFPSSLLHAASPRVAVSARAARPVVRRRERFIVSAFP